MQTVIHRYEQLQQHNASLSEAIQKDKQELERLRQSAEDELPEDETNELAKRRKELDQSEREEAALMVELESLLKGMESSLSISASIQGSEQPDLEQTMKNIDQRRSLLHQLCEQFVAAGKEGGNEYACAIDLILRHDNSIPLSVLKTEMKAVIADKSKVLPVCFCFLPNAQTIYGLVGDQIILIDRKTKDPTVSCLV